MKFQLALAITLLALVAGAMALGLGSGVGAQGEAPGASTPVLHEEKATPADPLFPANTVAQQAELPPVHLDLGSAEDLKDEDSAKGEQLEYEIRWNGIPAGRTFMRVRKREGYPDKQGPEVWNVRMDTRSTRLLSHFYAVKDKAITLIDVKGGFSRYFYQNKREGAYKAEERIRADYTAARMEVHYEQSRPDDRLSTQTIPLAGKVLDPLAALYYMRSIDFGANLRERAELAAAADTGKLSRAEYDRKLKDLRIILPICTERRVWNTELTPIAREPLDLPGVGKKQPCVLVIPHCEFNGLFQRRGELRMWVHEATRVPVKLEVEIPIGACEVLLDRHLNSPFEKQP